jgi:hypothetical protein
MTNRLLSLVGLTLLFAAVSASAQTVQTAQVKVPFSFVVGSKVMPAATYQVEVAPSTGLVILSAATGAKASRMSTHEGYRTGEDNKAVLRFQPIGGLWVLQQVTVGGYAQKLVPSKAHEIELAKSSSPVQQTLIASVTSAR